MESINLQCGELVSLELQDIETLSTLTLENPLLMSCIISMCGRLTNISVSIQAEATVKFLCLGRFNILVLNGYQVTSLSEHQFSCLKLMEIHCLKLIKLDMCRCERMGERFFTEVPKECPLLTHLVLNEHFDVTPRAMMALEKLNFLSHIDLQSSFFYAPISMNLKALEVLSLVHCRSVTDAWFNDFDGIRNQYPKLRVLDVRDTSVTVTSKRRFEECGPELTIVV